MSANNSKNEMKNVIKRVLQIEKIETREQLKRWCGGSSKDKLYAYVKAFAPAHWDRIQDPKAYVRFYSQKMVSGYRISRG